MQALQTFFEQLAGVVQASLQWLDEERGIEAQEIQEMEIDFKDPFMDGASFIYIVEAAGWVLYVQDYHQNNVCEVYYSHTTEGYCRPDCQCADCQELRKRPVVA